MPRDKASPDKDRDKERWPNETTKRGASRAKQTSEGRFITKKAGGKVTKGKDIHVVPKGPGKWQVKPEGSAATSTHRTQQAAVDKARPTARRNESELVIHRRDGTIRDADSHGHDPNPPKG